MVRSCPLSELQREHATQSVLRIVHEAQRQMPHPVGEVGLVQRHLCGVRALTTESLGNPVTLAGRNTFPGMVARAVLDVTTAVSRVANRLSL